MAQIAAAIETGSPQPRPKEAWTAGGVFKAISIRSMVSWREGGGRIQDVTRPLCATLSRRLIERVVQAALSATLIWPGAVTAQRCTGDLNKGCTHEGAVCSPVTSGEGSSGHCATPPNLPKGEKECECVGTPSLKLTGTWLANDGSIYFLRQNGDELWWAGFSVESPAGLADLHKGVAFTNVFNGHVSGNIVSGDWVDVPRGSNLNAGTLTLNASNIHIERQSETGGFGPTQWDRTSPTPPPEDIFTTFDKVKKNQNTWHDHSLLDNLKPAKSKPVAMFGTIVRDGDDLDPMHVNYGTADGRTYQDFICLNNNDSPPDADIDFIIAVDRTALDSQLGFWSSDWETEHLITPANFLGKLQMQNKIKVESIMFGGTTECGDEGTTSFLLPGWQQGGAAGVSVNGVPIAGQMTLIDRDLGSSRVTAILGRPIAFDARVRVIGNLVLDCGHGLFHNCGENDAEKQNQEVHPVHAIDFVQNFNVPRPFALLTGVWSSDDAGTYYVRQIDNTVWWLGLSVDEGRTFANVFRGTLQSGQVSGNWMDVPLGQTEGGGGLAFTSSEGPQSTVWHRTNASGGFGGSSWEKLYDTGTPTFVLVFESAVANGPSWPATSEPFEFTVAGRRLEATAKNRRSFQPSVGAAGTEADLGLRIPLNLSQTHPVPVTAQFAGYRASWRIDTANVKLGSYVQMMTTPHVLRADEPDIAPGKIGDRDARNRVLAPSASQQTLPSLAIHYRIERAATQ